MTTLQVNGRAQQLDVDPSTPVLWALRDSLGLTGTVWDRGADAWAPPPGDPITHFTAAYAKLMCSAVFVSGFDADFARSTLGDSNALAAVARGLPIVMTLPRSLPEGVPGGGTMIVPNTIARIAATKTTDEWLDLLGKADIPCARCATPCWWAPARWPSTTPNSPRAACRDPTRCAWSSTRPARSDAHERHRNRVGPESKRHKQHAPQHGAGHAGQGG